MNSLAFGEEYHGSLPLCPLALDLMKEASPAPKRLEGLGRRPIRGQAFLCPDSTWVTLGRGTDCWLFSGATMLHLQAAISHKQNLCIHH